MKNAFVNIYEVFFSNILIDSRCIQTPPALDVEQKVHLGRALSLLLIPVLQPHMILNNLFGSFMCYFTNDHFIV